MKTFSEYLITESRNPLDKISGKITYDLFDRLKKELPEIVKQDKPNPIKLPNPITLHYPEIEDKVKAIVITFVKSDENAIEGYWYSSYKIIAIVIKFKKGYKGIPKEGLKQQLLGSIRHELQHAYQDQTAVRVSLAKLHDLDSRKDDSPQDKMAAFSAYYSDPLEVDALIADTMRLCKKYKDSFYERLKDQIYSAFEEKELTDRYDKNLLLITKSKFLRDIFKKAQEKYPYLKKDY